MKFLRETASNSMQPALLPYGPKWKLLHRIQSPLLSKESVKTYRPAQEMESLQLLHNLLSDHSANPARYFHQFGTSLVFNLAFGKRMPAGDEQEVIDFAKLIERKVNHFRWMPFLVDAFPSLQYLPEFLQPWKKIARDLNKAEITLMTAIMEEALQRPGWTWTREVTTNKLGEDLPWDQYCYLLGELYTAGHITVTGSLNIFTALASQNPGQVRRAHKEIDSVIGDSRIPVFEDIERLPFVQAFANEVLRYRPLLPVGIPHSVSREDEYLGYRIPKDAFIIPHHWSMERDPDVHKDPTTFRPDRWIENPNLPLAAFGFGRRACPGEQMGRSSFGITVMRCLWAFDFIEAPEGASLTPRGQNIVALPGPSAVSLRVRSVAHRDTIERGWSLWKEQESQSG
ncbi:hypothetical protein FE257_004503 [Aspergillus nanangensis]|uniref:Cytochrome P450 n=1 Tax=Aspergillus nanangensis TaxID=2582783 RepID=A0AAD4GZA8_ASPNN|nr:hypothetical protein FE257_004503 [Aspergillus nanangensis]